MLLNLLYIKVVKMNSNTKAVRLYLTAEQKKIIRSNNFSVSGFATHSIVKASVLDFLSMAAYLKYTSSPNVKPMRVELKKGIYDLIKDEVKFKHGGFSSAVLKLKANKSGYVNFCVHHALLELGVDFLELGKAA
jgi:hypothetical protein